MTCSTAKDTTKAKALVLQTTESASVRVYRVLLREGGLIPKVQVKTLRSAGCFIFWEASLSTNKYIKNLRGFLKYLMLKILFS